MKGSVALRNPVGTVIMHACGTTTIEAANFVQLAAAITASVSAMEVINTTDKVIYIAVGAANVEVIKYALPPSASGAIFPIEIKKGARISAKASVDAVAGFVCINWLA